MDLARGRAAELGSEIALVRVETPNDGGGRPHSDIEFFQDIVVDQCDLDVLVAAAFTGRGIDLAEKIEGRSLRVRVSRLLARGAGNGWDFRGLRGGSSTAADGCGWAGF